MERTERRDEFFAAGRHRPRVVRQSTAREREFAEAYRVHGSHLYDKGSREWDEDTALAYQSWLYQRDAISLADLEWRVESIMRDRAGLPGPWQQTGSWQRRALSYCGEWRLAREAMAARAEEAMIGGRDV